MPNVADHLVKQARQEYSDMPGLRLTARQAGRLWHLDSALCDALLAELVHEHFLARTPDGAYLRPASLTAGGMDAAH